MIKNAGEFAGVFFYSHFYSFRIFFTFVGTLYHINNT